MLRGPLRVNVDALTRAFPCLQDLRLTGPQLKASHEELKALTRLSALRAVAFQDVSGVKPRTLRMLAGEPRQGKPLCHAHPRFRSGMFLTSVGQVQTDALPHVLAVVHSMLASSGAMAWRS